ncbi:hypothetical protein DLM85_08645 [Hymenobacter edaphi]|uniref:Uncharacterized protein n=1 Tax=Hymenobacter edaphi TaxID=2211146 RepID=A0A328BN26_9BACT|nr:hypothetical protein DLM85_08645 [Hymenobacter edaphi]
MIMRGFKAYQIDTDAGPVQACSRSDYYTIYLLSGHQQLPGAGRVTELEAAYLLMRCPARGAASKWLSSRQRGYACLFTEAFVQECSPAGCRQPWLMPTGMGRGVHLLRGEQAAYLTSLFQKMLFEQQSTYLFKHELLRSYLHLLLHEVMRLATAQPLFRCYFRRPGQAGPLGSGWRSRQRPLS